MKKEIGSNFWIRTEDLVQNKINITPSYFKMDSEDFALLSSGRLCISFVIEDIINNNTDFEKKVLLPSFTCQSVIEPFDNYGFKIYYYDIYGDMKINENEFLSCLVRNNIKIVLIHQYFGFETVSNMLIERVKNYGAIIIEDCTQSLFSYSTRKKVDYYVSSLRKWTGVLDGGLCVKLKGLFDKSKIVESNETLEKIKLDAEIKKNNYINGNDFTDKTTFLKLFEDAERILDNQKKFHLISQLSINIQINVDVNALIQKRRQNYLYVLERLNAIKKDDIIFNFLDESNVPLYFPLFVNNRKNFQAYLRDINIYAPIIWPKSNYINECSKEVDFIYDRIICLPIDQRYDIDDMNRMCNAIEQFYKSNY